MALKIALSLGLLVYLFRRTDLKSLKEAWQAYSLGWWLAGLGVYLAFQALSVKRWQFICRCLGFSKSYLYFLRLYFINMYFNTLLPGLMGGDVVRSYYLVKDGFSIKAGSFSVILDRGAGLLGLSLILLGAIPWKGHFLPSSIRNLVWFLSGGVVLGALALSLGTSLKKLELFRPLEGRNLGLYATYGLGVQLLYALQFAVMAQGLKIPLSYTEFLVIVPVTGFLSSLPVSLGGLGVREASLVYFLSLKDIPQEKGLLLGLLVYSTVLVGALPGLYFYLRGRFRA